MSFNPSLVQWHDILLGEIDPGSRLATGINDFNQKFLSNQETLRQVQINSQFLQVSTNSASFVQVAYKKIWIPTWCKQPVSNRWSDLRMELWLQSYQTGGTSHDVRVRVNGGSWVTQTGLTHTSWAFPDNYYIDEDDYVGAYGTGVDMEVEALVTGGGFVFVRDRSGASHIKRLTP